MSGSRTWPARSIAGAVMAVPVPTNGVRGGPRVRRSAGVLSRRLGFLLVEVRYVPAQDKRWVVVAPRGPTETHILPARAASGEQRTRIGDQTGGRGFLFLHTDVFWRDYEDLRAKGVVFVREPEEHDYGTVAVFSDLWGNRWDLPQRAAVERRLISRGRGGAGPST